MGRVLIVHINIDLLCLHVNLLRVVTMKMQRPGSCSLKCLRRHLQLINKSWMPKQYQMIDHVRRPLSPFFRIPPWPPHSLRAFVLLSPPFCFPSAMILPRASPMYSVSLCPFVCRIAWYDQTAVKHKSPGGMGCVFCADRMLRTLRIEGILFW